MLQTNTQFVTGYDSVIMSKVVRHIAIELSHHVADEYQDVPGAIETLENFMVILQEEVLNQFHNVGLMRLIRVTNRIGLRLLECSLTGCENHREHEFYKAIITTVMYARDKVIDGCLREGIIPGQSHN